LVVLLLRVRGTDIDATQSNRNRVGLFVNCWPEFSFSPHPDVRGNLADPSVVTDEGTTVLLPPPLLTR
jgi:hypothetical protein